MWDWLLIRFSLRRVSRIQSRRRLHQCAGAVAAMLLLATTNVTVAVAAAPAVDSVYCPAYVNSPLYRPRQNQITVGPQDDWQSIINGAAANTEILMTDGDYRLSQYAVVIDQPDITVRAASGNRDSVRIFGLGYGPDGQGFLVFGQNVTIADLTISDIRDHAISVHPSQGAAHAHIYNVSLFNIGTQHIKGTSGGDSVGGVVACSSIGYTPGGVKGDYLGAIDAHNAVDWVVRDNYIYNINGDGTGCNVDRDCGTYIYGAPAIYIWRNARGSIVERNTIVDSFRGIALGLGGGHDGGVIRNNFIFRPVAGDAGIELWTASNLLVEHNTVILGGNYPGAIEYRDSSNITVRNNLISETPYDRGGNSGIGVAGNITDASVNDLVAAGDPHLKAGSRAIGAGVASNLATDIDGDARSGRWDVGADQFVDGDQTPPVVSLSGVTAAEADGAAQVTLTLDRAVQSPVRVVIFTQGQYSTATPGQDFWGFTRQVEFAPGVTRANVSVAILDDDVAESLETIFLRVKVVDNARLATSPLTTTVNIADDD